jgi:hypothetical protein
MQTYSPATKSTMAADYADRDGLYAPHMPKGEYKTPRQLDLSAGVPTPYSTSAASTVASYGGGAPPPARALFNNAATATTGTTLQFDDDDYSDSYSESGSESNSESDSESDSESESESEYLSGEFYQSGGTTSSSDVSTSSGSDFEIVSGASSTESDERLSDDYVRQTLALMRL